MTVATTRMTMHRTLLLIVCAMAIVAVFVTRAASGGAARVALGPGTVTVDVGIEHSRFSVEELRVHRGTTVRFVVHNGDPIRHELIVGDDAVHARHESGHEAAHAPVPGEVSVEPASTAVTTYRFEAAGTVRFACHLPRHRAYGMEGVVTVIA